MQTAQSFRIGLVLQSLARKKKVLNFTLGMLRELWKAFSLSTLVSVVMIITTEVVPPELEKMGQRMENFKVVTRTSGLLLQAHGPKRIKKKKPVIITGTMTEFRKQNLALSRDRHLWFCL